MRVSYIVATVVALSAMSAVAIAASVSTEDFVRRISVANEFSIESGKLALEKSQNKDIKRFAERMIDDHTKQDADLSVILQTLKSGIHAEEKLDDVHQKMMNKLQTLTTDDFNREYISMQTNVNQEATGLCSDYSEKGSETALKTFATDTLTTLKAQVRQAREIKD